MLDDLSFYAGTNPFKSFWMAGFECTDKLNAFGNRVDFLTVTGHLKLLQEDYQRLKIFNIQTVREGIRWSYVEKEPYQYDWRIVTQMIKAAEQAGIQQVWDLCHFGFPDDLTPLHPMFARRFASLCAGFVKLYRLLMPDAELIVTPINEVSFLSWLGGDACGTSPYCRGYGWEVKYALMRAYIEGIGAMKKIDPTVRLLTTEPLVNIVPPLYANAEQTVAALDAHTQQFQVLDILAGKICPELGGQPGYLDVLGFNFYYNNQWAHGTNEYLPWRNLIPDSRWASAGDLLEQAYVRYGCPIVLSETSHPGEDRPLWINYISDSCEKLLQKNIPLWGVCWYPIVDRPDWDHLTPWHQAGIWDVTSIGSDTPMRMLHHQSAKALFKAQQRMYNLTHKRMLLNVL